MEIRIKIPEELKSYIVDDWAQICRKKRLTILPARSIKFTSMTICLGLGQLFQKGVLISQ